MPDKNYKDTLFKGAKPITFNNAQQLRGSQTEAEKKLWGLLRNKQLKGKKFRRQHPIGNYILDFYCNEDKLAVELDGEIHKDEESRKYDNERTLFLKENNITVIRFWNDEVIKDAKKVLEKISQFLK